MNQALTFRLAKQEDVPLIVNLLADDPLGRQRERPEQLDTYLDAYQRIAQDPQQELTVATEGDAIVATFQLSFIQYLTYRGGTRAQLEAVRVAQNHRGQGIGHQMIAYAVERAKLRKAHVLQLTTDKQRPEAIRFYESLGFRASHEGMKLHFR